MPVSLSRTRSTKCRDGGRLKICLERSKLVLAARSDAPEKWYWIATASAPPAAPALKRRPAHVSVAESAVKNMLPIRIKSIFVCQRISALASPRERNLPSASHALREISETIMEINDLRGFPAPIQHSLPGPPLIKRTKKYPEKL